MNIYVGNLSYEVTDDDLLQAFQSYGHVASAKVIKDNFSGASRGFGFVEMPNNSEADAAMKALNGSKIKGNAIKLSEAQQKSGRKKGRRRRSW